MTNSFSIFKSLVFRDFLVLLSTTKDTLINNVIFVVFQVVIYEHFFKHMGFPLAKTHPVVLGGLSFVLLLAGYSNALNYILDLEFGKLIKSHIILPFSTNWLLFRCLVSSFIFFLFQTIPIVILSAFIMSINYINTNIIAFISIYLASCLFLSMLYFMLAFALSYDTFRYSLFSRIVLPMSFLGPVLYTYKDITEHLPILKYIVLLNPMTYCAEGIKHSILGGSDFLNTWICVLIIILMTALILPFTRRSFIKRLDSV